MTRDEMIVFIEANPFIPITHSLFDDSEYLYSDNQGNVWDENGNLFEDWYSPDISEGLRLRNYDEWLDGWEIKKGITLCKYKLIVPAVPTIHVCQGAQTLCGAYSESTPPKGARWKHWAHYPLCEERNCPLKHPELLDGATLETEEQGK